jgi:hypothetical protein
VVVPVVPPEAPLLWAETDVANGRVAKLIAKALAQTAFDISEGFITMVPFLFLCSKYRQVFATEELSS